MSYVADPGDYRQNPAWREKSNRFCGRKTCMHLDTDHDVGSGPCDICDCPEFER